VRRASVRPAKNGGETRGGCLIASTEDYRREAPKERTMGKDINEKNVERQGSDTDEAMKKKEDWINRNGPVLIVAGLVLLIALMGMAMKMCG
jgi:hypothetical protein